MRKTLDLTVTGLATPIMGQTDIRYLSDGKHHGLSIFCIKEGAFSSATFVIWALAWLWTFCYAFQADYHLSKLGEITLLLCDSVARFLILCKLLFAHHIHENLSTKQVTSQPRCLPFPSLQGPHCHSSGSSLLSPAGPLAFSRWRSALKGLQCLKGIFNQYLSSQRSGALHLLKICRALERILSFLQL